MKRLLILAVITLSAAVHAQQFISPQDKGLAYVGRWDFRTPNAPTCAFPGTQIHAQFEGSTFALLLKPYSGYIMVKIDNEPIVKVNADRADSIYIVNDELKDKMHRATITFCNEGMDLRPAFKGLLIEDGKELGRRPVLPLRKIEIIGDSHTCGYGVEASSQHDHYTLANSNVYYSYASVMARSLNAQVVISARSGNGVYRNYSGPKEGNPNNMTAVWDRYNINDSLPRWDFSRYTPDVLCITLGDNDCSTKGYDIELLSKAYYKLYEGVRREYPETKIVFVSSPAMGGEGLKDQQETMAAIVSRINSEGDSKVSMFKSPTRDLNFPLGADWHMGKQQQATFARLLGNYIKGLMNWQ